MKLISLHASICAGKSSLLSKIREHYDNVLTIPENIDDWKEGLKKWYREKTKESLMELQDIIQKSLRDNYESILKNKDNYDFIVLERSPIDTAEIFLDFNREILGEEAYEHYYKLCYELEEKLNQFDRLKIYIKTRNLSNIFKRSQIRDKGIIDKDYLKGVFDKYDEKFSSFVTLQNDSTIEDMFNKFKPYLS